MSGMMIALQPPPEIAEALAQAGGETVANMHVTLFYFPQGSVDPAVLRMATQEYASVFPTGLSAQISGYGQFENGESNVLVALVDIPYIDQVKEHMREILTGWGIPINDQHGLTPHITIQYSDERFGDLPELPGDARAPFVFEDLVLAVGPQWMHFPLSDYVTPMAAQAVVLHEKPDDDRKHVTPEQVGARPPGLDNSEPEVTEGERKVAEVLPNGIALPAWLDPSRSEPSPEVSPRQAAMAGTRAASTPSDGDIAAAAREFLQKSSMKDFTPGEQAVLINEGEGVTAANLDRLELEGTHYHDLEARLTQADDEQVGIDLMWG